MLCPRRVRRNLFSSKFTSTNQYTSNQSSVTVRDFPFSFLASAPPQPTRYRGLPSGVFSFLAQAPPQPTSSDLPSGTYESNQLSVTVIGFPFSSSAPPQPTSSGLPSGVDESNLPLVTSGGLPSSCSHCYPWEQTCGQSFRKPTEGIDSTSKLLVCGNNIIIIIIIIIKFNLMWCGFG